MLVEAVVVCPAVVHFVVVVVVCCGCYLPVAPHSCPNDRCLRSESCSTGALTGENKNGCSQ